MVQNKLSSGVKVDLAEFQASMDNTLAVMDNIFCSMDVVLIASKTPKECDKALERVVQSFKSTIWNCTEQNRNLQYDRSVVTFPHCKWKKRETCPLQNWYHYESIRDPPSAPGKYGTKTFAWNIQFLRKPHFHYPKWITLFLQSTKEGWNLEMGNINQNIYLKKPKTHNEGCSSTALLSFKMFFYCWKYVLTSEKYQQQILEGFHRCHPDLIRIIYFVWWQGLVQSIKDKVRCNKERKNAATSLEKKLYFYINAPILQWRKSMWTTYRYSDSHFLLLLIHTQMYWNLCHEQHN